MEQFHDGHHVRLRSRVRGSYLHADKDGAGVSLGGRRASPRAAWAVHLHRGNDGTQYLLLHSAAYGRYLAATAAPAPLPLCGSRVVQRDYDQPQPHAVAIRWQAAPSGSGSDVLLRHVGTHYRYLRANGKFLRWVHGVTVDEGGVNLTTMMHWVVEPIPPRLGMPALPPPIRERQPGDLSVVVLGLAAAPQHLIRYVQATADGFYPEDPEEGWYVHHFRGRSVNLLWHALAIELHVPNIIMCVRAGRYGRLTPLVVNLPRDGHGHTFEIVVIVDGTPASAELRHPDVDAE